MIVRLRPGRCTRRSARLWHNKRWLIKNLLLQVTITLSAAGTGIIFRTDCTGRGVTIYVRGGSGSITSGNGGALVFSLINRHLCMIRTMTSLEEGRREVVMEISNVSPPRDPVDPRLSSSPSPTVRTSSSSNITIHSSAPSVGSSIQDCTSASGTTAISRLPSSDFEEKNGKKLCKKCRKGESESILLICAGVLPTTDSFAVACECVYHIHCLECLTTILGQPGGILHLDINDFMIIT